MRNARLSERDSIIKTMTAHTTMPGRLSKIIFRWSKNDDAHGCKPLFKQDFALLLMGTFIYRTQIYKIVNNLDT